jgi:transcriptional regulator with XRE-family HTH domain
VAVRGSEDPVTLVTPRSQQSIGDLLRQWRERRRISQLELASRAEVSQRHLSFVENGRSVPSRDMVLRLAERLDLALRERNHLLLAAGYAPVYDETSLDAPRMAAVQTAVQQLLSAHEPFPAIVIDRLWNRIYANDPTNLFVIGIAEELRQEPVNVLRVSLHPEGMAPRIVNLGEWRAHLLHRLRQQIAMTADPELIKLYDELLGYPCDQQEPTVELPGPGQIAVPLRLRYGGRVLSFFATVSMFGTPLDVTVSELAIESFFPSDEETATVLRNAVW